METGWDSGIGSGMRSGRIPEKRQLQLLTEYHFSIGQARPASPKGSGSCPTLLSVTAMQSGIQTHIN